MRQCVRRHRKAPGAIAAALAVTLVACATPVRPTVAPWDAPLTALWENPQDLTTRDLYYGPWGKQRAPDPDAVYTYMRPKTGGTNPGVVVRDPRGRVWHVKQAPDTADARGDEGPVEVVVSRVLSAVGYHQPPIYYVRAFSMKDPFGVTRQDGGRFRLSEKRMKDRGGWSWQQNPFVGTRPYQGLLVILMVFNSSDLKNSNNTLYEVREGDMMRQWYVVRDLGTALGETGRLAPVRSSVERFAREPLIADVRNGFVEFNYHGLHKELVRGRITPDDVGWACALLSRLTDRQWHDAFRAGGFPPETIEKFLTTVHARIAEGLAVGGDDWLPVAAGR